MGGRKGGKGGGRRGELGQGGKEGTGGRVARGPLHSMQCRGCSSPSVAESTSTKTLFLAPAPPARSSPRLPRGHASENPELPSALAAHGVRFLGPPAGPMAALGDKVCVCVGGGGGRVCVWWWWGGGLTRMSLLAVSAAFPSLSPFLAVSDAFP